MPVADNAGIGVFPSGSVWVVGDRQHRQRAPNTHRVIELAAGADHDEQPRRDAASRYADLAGVRHPTVVGDFARTTEFRVEEFG